MKEKLRRDHHLFPSQRDQIGYIFARTEGKAAEALIPRMKPGQFRVKTADDVFTALETIFEDRHRKSRAKASFRKLTLKEGGDYHTFHMSFMNLALIAEIPVDEYKSEFAYRLPESIACQVVREEEDDEVDFEEFQRQVSLQAYAAEKRAQRRAERTKDPDRTKSNNWRSKSATPSAPKIATPPPVRTPMKTPDLTDETTCFSCGGKGHLARDCPIKRSRSHPLNAVHFGPGRDESSSSPDEPEEYESAPEGSEKESS